MRKFLIPLLMASALVPATANAEPGDRGVRTRGERSEASDNSPTERPQRVERSERSTSDAPRVRSERAERPARVERSVDVQAGEPARTQRFERSQTSEPVQQVRRIDREQTSEPVRQVRRIERRNDGFVGAVRQVGSQEATRQQNEVQVQRRDRDGFSGLHDRIVRNGDRTDSHRRWSGDWRRDHRYDWRSYRNRYSSLFRLGRYYDPYGWNYRRFSIGFSLWPSYYGSSNWLNDPWQYRLPPAYGPYRWVRYYDDALLVNIYTGEVADVLYNFFW